jgi:hypothetical protein
MSQQEEEIWRLSFLGSALATFAAFTAFTALRWHHDSP